MMTGSRLDIAAMGYKMLPRQILDQISPQLTEEIVRSVIRDSERARHQAWVALFLALVAIMVCAAVAWHYVDKGAATAGATIMTGAAVSIVGIFIGHRVLRR